MTISLLGCVKNVLRNNLAACAKCSIKIKYKNLFEVII